MTLAAWNLAYKSGAGDLPESAGSDPFDESSAGGLPALADSDSPDRPNASDLPRLGDGNPLGVRPVTIFANSRYGLHRYAGPLPDCPVRCEIRHDAAALKTADVVVWNPRWMSPIKGLSAAQVASKPRFQKWVFNFDFEAPIYKGNRVEADTTARLAPGIDWTMTFKASSDFFKPAFRLIPPEHGNASAGRNYAEGKSMLLLWLVSNCVGPRMRVFRRLVRYLPEDRVKIIGRCGEKSECGDFRQEDEACMDRLMGRFKFYASFENSRCDGYITEKLRRPYDRGMVPVVWGGLRRADYEAIAPGDSFIHVDDFGGSAELLAEYLLRLDRDDAAYSRYFGWRASLHVADARAWALGRYCLLCREVRKPAREQRPSRSFGDLVGWWYSASCRSDAAK